LTGGMDHVQLWPLRTDPDHPDLMRVGPAKKLATAPLEGASASADAQILAVANSNGAMLFHLGAPRQRFTLGPQYDVRRVAVSPDGRWVMPCSFQPDPRNKIKSARIWDGQTGKHVHDLPLDGSTDASFSPDSKWLVTSTQGLGCKLWEVETWKEIRDLGYFKFAFSPDSQLLALCDADGIIRLVHVTTGKEIVRLTAPEPSWYQPACFSPDGAHLIASHADYTAIYVWDLRLIRQQLKTMGLDWEGPDYPAPTKDFARPLRLIVEKDAAP
jgi:WD40 repeat protein